MSTTEVREFAPPRVRPLPRQPRQRFRGIAELAASIKEIGQQQAGIVTLVKNDPNFDAELVDGERRLRACTMAGVKFRAEVRGAGEAEEIFAASFAANFGRQEHDALEIAEAMDRLRQTKTIEQLSRLAGRSVGWVTSHLSLLKLHVDVRKLMVVDDVHESPRLTFSLALLLTQAEPAEQIRLAKQIVKGEGMSLVEARRLVLRSVPSTKPSGQRRERTIKGLGSLLSDTRNRVGIYMDMPGPDINAAIDALDHAGKQAIVKQIEDLTAELYDLGETIEERIKATQKKKAS